MTIEWLNQMDVFGASYLIGDIALKKCISLRYLKS